MYSIYTGMLGIGNLATLQSWWFFFFGYCKNTLKLKVKKKNWCCCVGSDQILQKSLF